MLRILLTVVATLCVVFAAYCIEGYWLQQVLLFCTHSGLSGCADFTGHGITYWIHIEPNFIAEQTPKSFQQATFQVRIPALIEQLFKQRQP